MEKQRMRFWEPAKYIITVMGQIAPGVIEILPNFYVGNPVYKNKNKNTQVEGVIKDQIALSGLLNYLSDLHYILLSVNIKVPKTKEIIN
jgi:hypothetical protein